MKREIIWFILFILWGLIVFWFLWGEVRDEASAEAELIQRNMKTPGFWINRHPAADQLILDAAVIQEFNQAIQKQSLTKDIMEFPDEISGEELKHSLEEIWQGFQQKKLYLGRRHAPKSFYNEIKADLNLAAIPSSSVVRWGFIVRFADQRFFPTEQGLSEKPNDREFDELQNSDLDLGTPVVILHKSLDGKWLYVESDISSGWVKENRVAVAPGKADVEEFLSAENFVVVTAAKADIFLDEAMTQHYEYVRMGTRFPQTAPLNRGVHTVRIPTRSEKGELILREGYIPASEGREGFLAYTPRHILEQAFKLFNAPYGWGGREGEQDCSRFLHEVFSTVGINLPRDSKNQAQVGKRLAMFNSETATEKEKLETLKGAMAGTTILPMKGHIMLYLGMVEERPYAIHAAWGYREKVKGKEVTHVLNRVVVTDLFLGEGSSKGSLLKRLTAVVALSD